MAKFVFSLQKVLDLREFEKRQAEVEMGKANAEVNRIQQKLETIASQKLNVTRSLDSGESFDVYAQAQNYFVFLEKKKEEALNEMAQAQIVLEEKRKLLMEAMQNVKVMEKLREKKLLEFKKEMEKEEMKNLEETVFSRIAGDPSRAETSESHE